MHRPAFFRLLRTVKVLRTGACFLAALVATAGLLGAWLPFPEVPDLAPRLRYYAAHKDQFDTLFVGSSRFQYQIIPRLFDEQTAALGLPGRSLNLGYAGMFPPENSYFLRQILALRPRGLKWVFFEVIDGTTRVPPEAEATQRTAYWHDWRHTRMAWEMIVEMAPQPASERSRLALLHARLCILRFLHYGQGAEWAESRAVPPKKKRKPPSWIERRGFDAEPEPGKLTGPVLASYLEMLAMLRQPRPPTALRPGLRAMLHEIQAEVRAVGAEAIFVLPPTVSPTDNFAALPDGLPGLLFNDVQADAALYAPELHYDAAHLNARGADAFTRALARRFVASRPPASP